MEESIGDVHVHRIRLPDLGVEYELYGEQPVQADGFIQGRGFHFHAKHSNWSFEVANDLGEFPSDIGGNAVFVVEGRHNGAGSMP